MRPYSTRTVKTGRYVLALLVLSLFYLALMLPAAAAVMTTLLALSPSGGGLATLPALLGLVASASYPLMALIAIVGGWARYADGRYPQALSIALLPMFNLALFGAAVGWASLLGD